jgi:peroxiredoxin Q/BCP
MVTLKAGDLAPDFELPSDAGTPLRLSSLRGRPVVLYFYPP